MQDDAWRGDEGRGDAGRGDNKMRKEAVAVCFKSSHSSFEKGLCEGDEE